MPILSSNRSSPATPKHPGKSPSSDLTVIAAGTSISGEVSTAGVVRVEGRIEGTVRAQGQVLIASGGVVDGDVFSSEAIVAGDVQGSIFADDRTEIQESGTVYGDITAPRMMVHDGGAINGRVRCAKPDGAKAVPPASKSPVVAQADESILTDRARVPAGVANG